MKKRKQANIKEMLKQKKNEASEENFDRIKISPYLLNSNDLTKEKHYEVSMFAMTYFCEHSNINEILDRYLEKEKKTNFNQDDLLSALIINVTSYIRQRRNYPLNMFMFESSYHESIGRFLLKHYEIKTKEDLQDANLFLVQNNLNHCHVMMNLNNQFRSDEQEYINRKKQKIGYQNLKQFLRVGSDHALRLYNQKHNLFIKYHINEITLEEMCEISTIERITRRDMNAEKIPNNQYDNCLVRLFNIFKTNPALIITHDAFYIFPQYLLIINNLTHEQERIVTERMDYFYEYTNAEDLLLLYRKNLKILKREERRKKFFLEYIRLVDKKGPPFNYLMWVKEDDESPKTYLENNKSICEAGPSGSNVWKKKTVAEKNDTIQSVPEPVTVQVERISNKENVIIENQLARNPREYISAQIPGSKYAEIIKLLREEDEIVAELKKEIIKNPLCSKMWDRNYKHILWNCIHFNLEERNEYFISILIKCHCRNRQKLNEMLKEIDIDVNVIQSFGEPIASSTQTMNNLIENERSSTNKNHQKGHSKTMTILMIF